MKLLATMVSDYSDDHGIGTRDYYNFYGKKNMYFTRVEIVSQKFTDNNCRNQMFQIRKVFRTLEYVPFEMVDSGILMPVTLRITHIFMSLNKEYLTNSTSCTREFVSNEEFNVLYLFSSRITTRDNTCSSDKWLFDYNSLLSEIDEEIYERIYFTANSAEFDKLQRSAYLMDASTCTSTNDWWRVLLSILIGILVVTTLILVIIVIWVYRRKRRYFIPLSTDDGESLRRLKQDPTLDSYIFSSNTYDRVQREL